MRYFNIEVKNHTPEYGEGVIKTKELICCASENLKELVLKIATECHENEDNDFISLTITQTTKNK
jgi:hypothetical protein